MKTKKSISNQYHQQISTNLDQSGEGKEHKPSNSPFHERERESSAQF